MFPGSRAAHSICAPAGHHSTDFVADWSVFHQDCIRGYRTIINIQEAISLIHRDTVPPGKYWKVLDLFI